MTNTQTGKIVFVKIWFKFEFAVMFSVIQPFYISPVFFRDIGKIDDLMADITEQQDVAREISEAISISSGEAFDEVDTSSVSCQRDFFLLSSSPYLSPPFLCHFLRLCGTHCVCLLNCFLP